MKVLMFGWEFPPVVSGGLGIACHGIVQGLLQAQIDITLVLPFSHQSGSPEEKHLQYIHALSKNEAQGGCIRIELIDAMLQPYGSPEQYQLNKKNAKSLLYGNNLWLEVARYAKSAAVLAHTVTHDIIHVHDWLTVLAGIAARKISRKPLVFHVHALEQDRCPSSPNPATQAIEQLGLESADRIIAVSQYTKNRIIHEYHIAPEKITVVHNGHLGFSHITPDLPKKNKDRFVVLFLGRVTEQKGPHYFIKAAEKILSLRQDVDFIIAGEGNELPYAISECARLGIASHVHFTGFLDRDEVEKYYLLSDVYVMPSVSEPFGIVGLEAIAHDVPVVLSKQSGISEVLTHSLKVDYWDIDGWAANIIALMDYPALRKEMLQHAKHALSTLTWENVAKKIVGLYGECTGSC